MSKDFANHRFLCVSVDHLLPETSSFDIPCSIFIIPTTPILVTAKRFHIKAQGQRRSRATLDHECRLPYEP